VLVRYGKLKLFQFVVAIKQLVIQFDELVFFELVFRISKQQ